MVKKSIVIGRSNSFLAKIPNTYSRRPRGFYFDYQTKWIQRGMAILADC